MAEGKKKHKFIKKAEQAGMKKKPKGKSAAERIANMYGKKKSESEK